MSLPHPPVLVITDRHQAVQPLDRIAEAVFEAGGRWLLLRDKDVRFQDRLSLLRRLVDLGRPFDATVMVSADVDMAKAAGVGVHVPRDGDVSAARRALGNAALIGYSAHDRAEAETAARAGADYVTLSPIFETKSKPGYGPALGLDGLRAVAASLPIPVVALGGVTVETAAACREAGAEGLAVMGPVMRATDPSQVVVDLLAAAWPG